MKKSYKKLYVSELLIFFILFINSFFHTFLSGYKMIIFLITLIMIFKFLFGLEKERKYYKKETITEILIFLFLFFIIYYLLGVIIGFAKTTNYWSINGFISIIIPIFVIIVLEEYLRFEILTKSEGENKLIIATSILFIFLDVSNILNQGTFNNSNSFFNFWAMVLPPTIAKNILCTYLSIKSGYKCCIIYSLIITLYGYLFPIVPNPNEYLKALIDFLLPILLFIKMNNYFKSEKDETIIREYNKNNNLVLFISSIVIIVLVYFISGYFKYYAITVATGSMKPSINVGDIVIINQKTSKDKLVIGDVIAFKYNGVIIVHRIHNIINFDGKRRYYTKGDANKDTDTWILTKKNIVGKIDGKVKFFGLPTVWLNSLLER